MSGTKNSPFAFRDLHVCGLKTGRVPMGWPVTYERVVHIDGNRTNSTPYQTTWADLIRCLRDLLFKTRICGNYIFETVKFQDSELSFTTLI